MIMVQDTSKVGVLLQHGISELQQVGIEEAQTDATQLLCSCLSLTRTALYLAGNDDISPDCTHRFLALLERRKNREPLAYILGEREFWSLHFKVTPAVLIPRPETEFLLDRVLVKRNQYCSDLKILDMCCGSGVIGVVLALELKQQVTAADISFEALTVARENSRSHNVDDRISFVQADLFTTFKENRPFSLIVSNPPYVRYSDIISTIEPEVSRYEPLIALNGGATGLEMIERMTERLADVLDYGGDFFMEIGEGQGQKIQSMFIDRGGDEVYEYVELYTDYSGRDRVIHIRRKEQ
jgi:release factor glutamine methyltransferase